MKERFQLLTGKYGQYFHDTRTGCPVELSEVLRILNGYGHMCDSILPQLKGQTA